MADQFHSSETHDEVARRVWGAHKGPVHDYAMQVFAEQSPVVILGESPAPQDRWHLAFARFLIALALRVIAGQKVTFLCTEHDRDPWEKNLTCFTGVFRSSVRAHLLFNLVCCCLHLQNDKEFKVCDHRRVIAALVEIVCTDLNPKEQEEWSNALVKTVSGIPDDEFVTQVAKSGNGKKMAIETFCMFTVSAMMRFTTNVGSTSYAQRDPPELYARIMGYSGTKISNAHTIRAPAEVPSLTGITNTAGDLMDMSSFGTSLPPMLSIMPPRSSGPNREDSSASSTAAAEIARLTMTIAEMKQCTADNATLNSEYADHVAGCSQRICDLEQRVLGLTAGNDSLQQQCNAFDTEKTRFQEAFQTVTQRASVDAQTAAAQIESQQQIIVELQRASQRMEAEGAQMTASLHSYQDQLQTAAQTNDVTQTSLAEARQVVKQLHDEMHRMAGVITDLTSEGNNADAVRNSLGTAYKQLQVEHTTLQAKMSTVVEELTTTRAEKDSLKAALSDKCATVAAKEAEAETARATHEAERIKASTVTGELAALRAELAEATERLAVVIARNEKLEGIIRRARQKKDRQEAEAEAEAKSASSGPPDDKGKRARTSEPAAPAETQ